MTGPSRGRAEGAVNPVKAVGVIAVMVIIGIVVLLKLGGGTHSAAVGTAPSHRSTTTLTTLPPATTTTTLLPPAAVKVQVLNGLLTGSLAGEWDTKLQAKGYKTGLADNATTRTTTSIIYVLSPGYQPEALALAATVGLPPTSVDLSYPPPPTAPIPASERTGANLALVIGDELAGSA
jgi:hypothetical protein